MDKFSAHLKTLINKKGMAPSNLSIKAGLDISAVGKILNGSTRSPKIDTLYKLSKALDIYPSELLPPEWQKPCGISLKTDDNLNLNMLEKSIKEVLEKKTSVPLTAKKKAQLIVAAYLGNINK